MQQVLPRMTYYVMNKHSEIIETLTVIQEWNSQTLIGLDH